MSNRGGATGAKGSGGAGNAGSKGGPGGPGGAGASGASNPRLSTGSFSARNSPSPRPSQGAGGQPQQVKHWANAANQQQNGSRTPPQSQQNQQRQPSISAAQTATAFPSLSSSPKPPASAAAAAGGSKASTSTAADQMKDRTLFVLVSLVGNTVVATTRTGARYLGILSATSPSSEGPDLGVVLSTAQELKADGSVGAPVQMIVIKGQDLDMIDASDVTLGEPVKGAAPDGFRTDVEISGSALADGQGRVLQKWGEEGDVPGGIEDAASGGLAASRTATKARASGGGAWDQFAANEARFGIKSSYDEDMYTTKLDRTGQDFREKEKRAERLAAEIMGQATTNSHMAEERGLTDDSGLNEEDKYGAVKRGPNAYVPPGARKTAGSAAPAAAAATKANGQPAAPSPAPAAAASSASNQTTAVASPKTVLAESAEKKAALALPGIAVNASSPTLRGEGNAAAASAAGASNESTNNSSNSNAKLSTVFSQFVATERERFMSHKQAQQEREKKAKVAELKNWSSNFKLKTPVPDELAKSAQAKQPSDIAAQKSLSPTTAHAQASTKDASAGSGTGTSSLKPSPSGGAGTGSAVSPAAINAKLQTTRPQSGVSDKLAETKAMLSKMTIPKIPLFDPEKSKAQQQQQQQQKAGAGAVAPSPSAAGNNSKMSARASAFKPFNPAAASFTPGGSSASKAPSTSPSASVASTQKSPAASQPTTATATPSNPFFGNKVLNHGAGQFSMLQDFTPFKSSKVPDASAVGPTWPYNGRSYRAIYLQFNNQSIPQQQHQQHPHLHQQPHHHSSQHQQHQQQPQLGNMSGGPSGMPVPTPYGTPGHGMLPPHIQQQPMPVQVHYQHPFGAAAPGMVAPPPPQYEASSGGGGSDSGQSGNVSQTGQAMPMPHAQGTAPPTPSAQMMSAGVAGGPGGMPPHGVQSQPQPQPQSFGMVFQQPPGPYRFQPQQYMVPGMAMPPQVPGAGPPGMAYGAAGQAGGAASGGGGGMPTPQMSAMGQAAPGIPFSPVMPTQGPPGVAMGGGMYSPRMASVGIMQGPGSNAGAGGPGAPFVAPGGAAGGPSMGTPQQHKGGGGGHHHHHNPSPRHGGKGGGGGSGHHHHQQQQQQQQHGQFANNGNGGLHPQHANQSGGGGPRNMQQQQQQQQQAGGQGGQQAKRGAASPAVKGGSGTGSGPGSTDGSNAAAAGPTEGGGDDGGGGGAATKKAGGGAAGKGSK